MTRLLGLLTILLAMCPSSLPAETADRDPSHDALDIEGLTDLGWNQYKAGQLAESATTFGEVLQKNPSDALAAELTYARGKILDKLDDFDPALALYDRVIEKYPKSPEYPDALYSAARLRMKLHQYEEAAALCEKLSQDYPNYAKIDVVLYYWARTLQELGKLDAADRLYFRVHKEYPKSRYWSDATCRLARRAWEAQNASQANFLLDNLLAADPPPPIREFALTLRAQIELSSKDWNKIRLAFERLVQDFPESKQRLHAEYWIAECHYRLKDIKEAENRFETLGQRILGHQEPWIAMIPLRRAQIALARRNLDKAYAIATSIEKNIPDFDQQYEADFIIGRCLAERAEFEDARTFYKRVIHSPRGEKTETAAMAQWLIGQSHFQQANFDAAVKEYSLVETKYDYPGWKALAIFETAKCYELSGDEKQAVQHYQRLIDAYGNTTSASEAKRRLKEIDEKNKEREIPE